MRAAGQQRYAAATGNTSGWITQTTWTDLKDNNATGLSAQWQLIQDKSDFESLANDTLAGTNGRKIVGTVRSYDGKQQYRGGLNGPDYSTLPFATPLRTDVPTLSTMVDGALNVLPDNGFFLGIEQGEVDRAMHANNLGRMIEAKIEFDDTIAFIDNYLNGNADHDHLLFGPDSNTNPFSEPTNNGAGAMPGALFQTSGHSNQLVPIFAKGAGSELLALYADQLDSFTDSQGRTFGRGAYLDQAELFSVFVSAVPEPSAIFAVSIAAAAILRRKRAGNA